VYFASGGAGAIFSRATVNALLVMWSILHRDYYQLVMERGRHVHWSETGRRSGCTDEGSESEIGSEERIKNVAFEVDLNVHIDLTVDGEK
jgi:hypothetical protein